MTAPAKRNIYTAVFFTITMFTAWMYGVDLFTRGPDTGLSWGLGFSVALVCWVFPFYDW